MDTDADNIGKHGEVIPIETVHCILHGPAHYSNHNDLDDDDDPRVQTYAKPPFQFCWKSYFMPKLFLVCWIAKFCEDMSISNYDQAIAI